MCGTPSFPVPCIKLLEVTNAPEYGAFCVELRVSEFTT